MLNKFTSLTEKSFDQKRREKITGEIDKLEKLDNVAKLGDLVR
jgi:hypothetical protein